MSAFITFTVSLSHAITIGISMRCPVLICWFFPPSLSALRLDRKGLQENKQAHTAYALVIPSLLCALKGDREQYLLAISAVLFLEPPVALRLYMVYKGATGYNVILKESR
uniref:Uncharacterized protein n=1 Tax=Micrurus spixii TaxID=129469 RepID=A0A2D4NKH5_9SAUR